MCSKPSLVQQPSLDQRLVQKMMVSPQMQQAFQFLQLPVLELSQLIYDELESNPLLEFDETEWEKPVIRNQHSQKRGGIIESLVKESGGLRELLMTQLSELTVDCPNRPLSMKIGEFLIDNLNEDGLLTLSLEELSTLLERPLAEVKSMLNQIQMFDPPGVGARSIQEALLLQLKRKGQTKSLAFNILSEHYDDFLHRRFSKIAKSINCSVEKVEECVYGEISKLLLHPCSGFGREEAHPIVPDVILQVDGENFVIEVIDEYSDRLSLNPHYMKMFDDPNISMEIKNFLKEKLRSVKWLMKNLLTRNSTLHLIVDALATLNRNFFMSPQGHLTPLTMKELALRLELHESTIARAVSHKYLASPRGILPLKSFFTKGLKTNLGEKISSKTIQEKVRKLIGEEDPSDPLSDEILSQILLKEGIHCARRTVAKYREAMSIGSSSLRRAR